MRERSLCVGFRAHYFKVPINIKLRNCDRGVVVGSEKTSKIVGLYFYSSWCRIDTNNSTSGSTELAFCWKGAVYQCIFNLFHVTIIRLTSCQIRFSCSSDIDIFLKLPCTSIINNLRFFGKECAIFTCGYYGTELYLLFPTFCNFTCIME